MMNHAKKMTRRLGAVALVAGAGVAGLAGPVAAEEEPVAAAAASVWIEITNGAGGFDDYGEHLWACDDVQDGYGIRTQIRYDGAIKAESVDWTHGNGCVDNNLSIAEGKDVNVRVCRINDNWQANSCSPWVWGEA